MPTKTLWADSEYRATVQETGEGLYWSLWRGDASVNGGLIPDGRYAFSEAYDATRGYAMRDRTLRFKESMVFDEESGRWLRKDGTDLIEAYQNLEDNPVDLAPWMYSGPRSCLTAQRFLSYWAGSARSTGRFPIATGLRQKAAGRARTRTTGASAAENT